jgi:hypothetical protein
MTLWQALESLERVEFAIADGEKFVRAQRARIDSLEAQGHDVAALQSIVGSMQATIGTLQGRHAQLSAAIDGGGSAGA